MTTYQSGFGNEFATEALEGALPVGRNSPQRCPFGLYAEQLSGTAFTALRADNRRSWLYRIRPSAMHTPFERIDAGRIVSDFGSGPISPNQIRWNPLPIPKTPTDFIEGIVTMAGSGAPRRTRSRCGNLRKGESCRPWQERRDPRHDGLHVRDPLCSCTHRARTELGRTPGRLLPLLARPSKAL